MTKMPEPTHTLINAREHLNQDGKIYIKYISEESVKQYGRDLLEEAEKACRRLEIAIDGGGNSYYRPADARQCVEAIRAMKEQIK